MTRYAIVCNIAAYDARFDTYTVVEVNSRKSISRHDNETEARAAIRRYEELMRVS
jgi:hypothetical protein